MGVLLQTAPQKLLRAGVLAAPLACFVGVFLMTAGTDESWIVLGVRGLAEHGRYGADSPFRSVHSTGGAYTVAAAALHLLGGGRLAVVRLVSVLSLAGLLFLTGRLAEKSLGAKSGAPWFMSAALLAVPGTFMLGSQAYGEILATMLVVAAAVVWGAKPTGSWGRRLWTGVLLGTAVATRLNCAVGFVALPFAALLNPGRRRSEIVDAAIAAVVAGALFGIESQGLWRLSVDPQTAQEANKSYGQNVSGLNLGYFIPLRLSFWSIAQDFLPFVAIAAILAGWCWARPRVKTPQGADFLLTFSVLMWGVWLVWAPIPHLRYVWPGLAGLAIVGGLILGVIDSRPAPPEDSGGRIGLGWIAVSLLVMGYMDAARTYAHGESDILSWQWHRGAPTIVEFGPLAARRSQKQMVQRLNELPRQEVVATVGFDTALSLLTRRSIVSVDAYYAGIVKADLQPIANPAGAMPRWLAITPFVNRFPFGRMTPAVYRWMELNCRLDSRFGPYLLYEVTGKYPDAPEIFALDAWGSKLPLTDAKRP